MRNINQTFAFRKTGFPVILLSLFILLTLTGVCDGQTKLQTIDGVYLEETRYIADPADPAGEAKIPMTKPYRLYETIIVDGLFIAFDIPGFNDYILENKRLLDDIHLRIDDVELSELQAYVESNEADVVRFRFDASKLEYEHLKSLYKLPGKANKEVLLGIKVDKSNILYYDVPANLYFKEIDKRGIYAWILIAAFALFFSFLIFRYKSAIKDSPLLTAGQQDIEARYSFGKTQFAFWTFIVIASFIYISILTKDWQSINVTGLILLGITSFTVTGSYLSNISDANKLIANQPVRIRGKNKNGRKSRFLEDILSDANGVNIQRMQALVFNLLFGIAFLQSVLTDYVMPEFTETQLILLGLSNGTYAFLKSTENK